MIRARPASDSRGRGVCVQAASLLLLNHARELAKAGAASAGALKLCARDDDTETVFHGHDYSEQDDGRKGNDVIQQLVFVTASDGRGQLRVGRGLDYQFAQLVYGLGRFYGCLRLSIWTNCGPSLLTGVGETGSASGKNRSSL